MYTESPFISPYLLRPLRTFEQAAKDRKSNLHPRIQPQVYPQTRNKNNIRQYNILQLTLPLRTSNF